MSLNGNYLKQIGDFQYLGSWVNSCSKEITGCIAKVYNAVSKFSFVWKLKMKTNLKVQFYCALIETTLLHGSEN